MAWSSEGFPLGESAVERITNGEIKGIMADGDKLYTVYGIKVENGAVVVCIDLNGSEYVDSVKAKTRAELTLFCGDTRHNTTLINSSGERNIGTQMDGGIWQQYRVIIHILEKLLSAVLTIMLTIRRWSITAARW